MFLYNIIDKDRKIKALLSMVTRTTHKSCKVVILGHIEEETYYESVIKIRCYHNHIKSLYVLFWLSFTSVKRNLISPVRQIILTSHYLVIVI